MSARDFLNSGRRGFLRGLGGAVLSLPLLEMTHGRVRAGAPAAKRFITFFNHGGTISNQWRAGKQGSSGSHHGLDLWAPMPGEALRLGPIHQPLADHVAKLLVLQSIDNRVATSQDGVHDGQHGISNVTALTAMPDAPIGTGSSDDRPTGPSIDHVVATRLAARHAVPFDRVHLEIGGTAAPFPYGCPFAGDSGALVSGEWDPIRAFHTLFDGVSAMPDPAVDRRRLMRRSVLQGVTSQLDGVNAQLRSWSGVASRSDMRMLEAHFEHLRALELEIEALSGAVCEPPSVMGSCASGYTCTGIPLGVLAPLQVRIAVAALRCGLTNVACLEVLDHSHDMGHEAREIGPTGTSAGRYAAWMTEMLAAQQWRMGHVAQMLAALDDPAFTEPDGGTMLDNALVLATSEFSDASSHVAWNQPVLLAGSAGGHFRTGRNIDFNTASTPGGYASSASTFNLFTSILQAMGESDTDFGTSNAAARDYVGSYRGPLPGLT